MGQVASNMGNPNVVNPQQANWGDLDTNEKLARVGAQGARGLANGMQNYYQQAGQLQNRGGGGISAAAVPQTPAIQPQIYTPGGPNALPMPNNGSTWAGDYGNNGRRNFYGQ